METMNNQNICKKVDFCHKIKILKDHDWACDAQFADSIKDVCSKCGDKTKI